MSYDSEDITRLKQALLSKSDVDLLHSIDKAQRLCKEQPKYIKDFLPLITPLAENEYPWVQKNASKCIKNLNRIEKKYKNKSGSSKEEPNGSIKLTNVNEYVDYLLTILKQKRHYQRKVQEIYDNTNIDLTEALPPISEQIRFIVEHNISNYLVDLFSKREIMRIAIMVGIDITNKSRNFDLISLEIYQALGFETSRSDYLEL